jgi:hypothetical protein
MALVQLIPSIVPAPFIGAFADRRRPSRVLCVGYGLKAVSIAGVAVSLGAAAPTLVVFVLAPLTSLSLTVTRPAQAALLPAIVRNPPLRVLLALHTFYYVLIGSLDLLCVILALSILHLGPGGAGYLNAALGGGALIAGFVTAFLVGRRHLSRSLTLSLAVAVAALALIGAFPRVSVAFILIATVGLAGTVFDITGRTLQQRAAPPDAIAGSFSILEALTDLGLASGAVLVRAAITIGGLRATVPQVEIQLLRSLPIFAALAPPSLEGVARELVPLRVPAGTVVISEGERGNRYFAVADGELAVTRDGQLLLTIARGDGFGEIALVHDVSRPASVTAITDAFLNALDKVPFIQTLTGHRSAASPVSDAVARHLGSEQPVREDGIGPEAGAD